MVNQRRSLPRIVEVTTKQNIMFSYSKMTAENYDSHSIFVKYASRKSHILLFCVDINCVIITTQGMIGLLHNYTGTEQSVRVSRVMLPITGDCS